MGALFREAGINALYGLGFWCALAGALFIAGCVHCAWKHDPFDGNGAPLWARIIGWLAIIAAVLIVSGWLMRAGL